VLLRGSEDSVDNTFLTAILSDSEFLFKTFSAGISVFLGTVLCFDGAAVVLVCWSVSLVLRWLSASLSPLESLLTSVFLCAVFCFDGASVVLLSQSVSSGWCRLPVSLSPLESPLVFS